MTLSVVLIVNLPRSLVSLGTRGTLKWTILPEIKRDTDS